MELAEFEREWRSPLSYITAHTSGSTGAPKPVRLLKSDMRASARATNTRFGISASSVLAIPLSLDYIAGKMMAVRAFEAGCELVQMPVKRDIVLNRHVTLLSVVPAQVPHLLRHPEYVPLIDNILVGGAPLADNERAAMAAAGYCAYMTYGMTETCSHVALSAVADADTVYEAMPGISFATDSRDCLVIESRDFSFGRLVTNDIVRLVDNRRFVWLARFDNVINSGGIKLYPEQIEREIAALLGDDAPLFYITGVPDTRWGTAVCMVAECDAARLEVVRRRIDASMADRHHMPKIFRAVQKIPRTSSGKILRGTEM